MADCKSIRHDLDLLLNKKTAYERAVSDIMDRIVDQTIKLNTCQNEQRKNTERNNNVWVEHGNGGKRRHTKRYKKSKKPKRRFTRSKIRV